MISPKSTLLQDLRSLPGAFWVLCAGTFINRFGSFVFPFLTIILSRRGISLAEIGFVLAGYGVGGFASTLAGGWFADRFGRRQTIALGALSQAGAVMALYFFSDIPALAGLTALSGFFGGFHHPAGNALVADLVPTERRLTAYTVLRQAGNGGFAFGMAAGGLLVNASPFWLFAGDALTTAVFGLLAFFALPEGRKVQAEEAKWAEAIRRLKADGPFWGLFLAQFCASFVFAQFASSYALEVSRREISFSVGGILLRPEQVYGALIALNGILIVLLELPITRFSAKFESRRIMAVGYALTGLGFAANVVTPGGFPLLAGMVLFTLGEMLVIPMVFVSISHIAPMNMRGRYMGTLAMAWTLGGVTGQNLGLRLFGIHPAVLWGSCALFGFAAAVAIMLWGKARAAELSPGRVLEPRSVET